MLIYLIILHIRFLTHIHDIGGITYMYMKAFCRDNNKPGTWYNTTDSKIILISFENYRKKNLNIEIYNKLFVNSIQDLKFV